MLCAVTSPQVGFIDFASVIVAVRNRWGPESNNDGGAVGPLFEHVKTVMNEEVRLRRGFYHFDLGYASSLMRRRDRFA
jgi:hypothetical protein